MSNLLKLSLFLFNISLLPGCFGYFSKDNELIGQVKKIKHQTPLICPDRTDIDMSLGIMRNGVGSMSAEDRWLTVDNITLEKQLKEASEKGSLVKIKYDERRLTFCDYESLVIDVEILK